MPAHSGKGERPGCSEGRPWWRRNEGHGWPNCRGLEGKNEAWDVIPGATRDWIVLEQGTGPLTPSHFKKDKLAVGSRP